MCPPRTMLKISFCFNTLSVIRSHGKRQRGICSCGYLGHPSGKCRCTPEQIARYRGRISGPLLDRIDLQIEVPSLPAEDLLAGRHGPGESSAAVRARVAAAATRQRARQGKPNGELQPKEVERWCALDAAGEHPPLHETGEAQLVGAVVAAVGEKLAQLVPGRRRMDHRFHVETETETAIVKQLSASRADAMTNSATAGHGDAWT